VKWIKRWRMTKPSVTADEDKQHAVDVTGKGFDESSGSRRSGWLTKPRVYLAVFSAIAFFCGTSYLIYQKIQQTQPWVKIYSNGTYVGMVPNEEPILASVRRLAVGYDVNVSMQPVYVQAPAGYNWRRVAELPTPATAIVADGRSIAYAKDVASARRVLDEVKKALSPAHVANDAKVRFRQDVSLRPAVIGVANIAPVDAAVRQILHPSQKTLSTVLSNRSGGAIPVRALAAGGIGKREVARSNGAVADGKSTGRSLLELDVEQVVTRRVTLPYAVKYRNNANLPDGRMKVIRSGRSGKAVETVRLHYVNGRLQSQTVEAKRVILKPQAEIRVRGTNRDEATGAWQWPVGSHVITSGFGGRILGGHYEFHPGIDIACSVGTPVYATNNGRVEQAGPNNGGYGIWVLMDNGGGIQSVYGHLSRVVVHAGEMVHKGQLIAYSGATGHVTGPHLHYEIRIGGHAVDPRPYM
jgi:murein DD-endopeptidase MepM/ murein hydrolase activator NlpD